MVEHIAANPGMSRLELSNYFHLSERQIQADIQIIRTDMQLPLVRVQGYRFVSEGVASATLNLREAQMLVTVLARARSDRSLSAEGLTALIDKLPALLPAHLQPLVMQTVAPSAPRRGDVGPQVFAALADALLRGSFVKVQYPHDDFTVPSHEAVIQPELLIPYLSSWYVVGRMQPNGRGVMLPVDNVRAVTVQAVAPEVVAPTRRPLERVG